MEEGGRVWIQIRSVLVLWCLCHHLLTVAVADSVTREEAKQFRDEVREMFYHAFNGYMDHAFPLDELRPLSCAGEDTLGGYALTLVRNFPFPFNNNNFSPVQLQL